MFFTGNRKEAKKIKKGKELKTLKPTTRNLQSAIKPSLNLWQ